MTDWMLYYADRRTARREAGEAIDEHVRAVIAGEEPDGTAYDAAKAAYLEHYGDGEGSR